jgi:hypothetical protein
MSSCTCRCPKCQPLRLVTRPLGPSVQASRPSFTAPGPSTRHVLLDHRIQAPYLYNTSQETCRTHSFRHDRVSHHSTYFVIYINNHSSQNEYARVLINLVFTASEHGHGGGGSGRGGRRKLPRPCSAAELRRNPSVATATGVTRRRKINSGPAGWGETHLQLFDVRLSATLVDPSTPRKLLCSLEELKK